MTFSEIRARMIATEFSNNQDKELGLVDAFTQVCAFLNDNPDRFSSRSKISNVLVLADPNMRSLAKSYFAAYHRSDLPLMPNTFPDNIVSVVMMEAYNYSTIDVDRIKIEHQLAMSAENCVGALLERYLDLVLRNHGWNWCCGSFVKAVDFVRRDQQGDWLALQIKNRDNSENSSSSAIRHGTTIQKWFRSFSRTGKTNWSKLPPLMQGYNLSEEGFESFVRTYLREEKQRTRKPFDYSDATEE